MKDENTEPMSKLKEYENISTFIGNRPILIKIRKSYFSVSKISLEEFFSVMIWENGMLCTVSFLKKNHTEVILTLYLSLYNLCKNSAVQYVKKHQLFIYLSIFMLPYYLSRYIGIFNQIFWNIFITKQMLFLNLNEKGTYLVFILSYLEFYFIFHTDTEIPH